ncbi:hypothetical protein Vadar_002906 [Vaccinium darrowii]|uniref:Uncharacterized protein n=1 Tax=Vaccinium darrowii TaxID=229202 RepID=A0ACB7X6X9_9ERIC|nr:hypothetical protein Vadar_002906 [Vaccinium darrowii]
MKIPSTTALLAMHGISSRRPPLATPPPSSYLTYERETDMLFLRCMYGRGRSLAKELRSVKHDYCSWKDQLQSGTPFHKVSNDRSFPYGDSLVELVRFIRNVFEHIIEADLLKKRHNKYIGNSPFSLWLEEKFVENEITKLFPHLLVALYLNLYEANIITLD